MRAARRTSPACVLGFLLWSGYADAAASSPQLLFRDCAVSEASDIGRLVAIDASSSTAPSDLTPSTVMVSCRDGHYDVEVTGAADVKTSRSIDLQQTAPKARTRLVAIAIVELLAANSAKEARRPAATDAPTPALAPPLASPIAPAPRDEAPARRACCGARAEALGSARAFAGGVSLAGGGVRAVFGRAFPISLDLLAEYGSRTATQGTVGILSLTLGATYGAQFALASTTLHAGAGVRGGLSQLSGRPDDPAVVAGTTRGLPWGGPMVEAGIVWAPVGALIVELALEAGYPLISAYAGSALQQEPDAGLAPSQRELGLHGGWAGATLGIGFGE